MKRFRFCIISLTGVLLTLVGCKKDETEPTAPADGADRLRIYAQNIRK